MKRSINCATALCLIALLGACVQRTPEMVEKSCSKADSYKAQYSTCIDESTNTHLAMAGNFTAEEMASVILSDCEGTLSSYSSNYMTCTYNGHLLGGNRHQVGFMDSFDATQTHEAQIRSQAKRDVLHKLKK